MVRVRRLLLPALLHRKFLNHAAAAGHEEPVALLQRLVRVGSAEVTPATFDANDRDTVPVAEVHLGKAPAVQRRLLGDQYLLDDEFVLRLLLELLLLQVLARAQQVLGATDKDEVVAREQLQIGIGIEDSRSSPADGDG